MGEFENDDDPGLFPVDADSIEPVQALRSYFTPVTMRLFSSVSRLQTVAAMAAASKP